MVDRTHNLATEKLRSFIERVEHMNEEIAALNADKSEIFSEAKGSGFDVKIMKMVIKNRRLDPNERQEQEAVFDTYMRALEGVGTKPATRAGANATTQNREPEPEPAHNPQTGEIIEDGEPEETDEDRRHDQGEKMAGLAEDAGAEASGATVPEKDTETSTTDKLEIPPNLDRRDEVPSGGDDELDFLG